MCDPLPPRPAAAGRALAATWPATRPHRRQPPVVTCLRATAGTGRWRPVTGTAVDQAGCDNPRSGSALRLHDRRFESCRAYSSVRVAGLRPRAARSGQLRPGAATVRDARRFGVWGWLGVERPRAAGLMLSLVVSRSRPHPPRCVGAVDVPWARALELRRQARRRLGLDVAEHPTGSRAPRESPRILSLVAGLAPQRQAMAFEADRRLELVEGQLPAQSRHLPASWMWCCSTTKPSGAIVSIPLARQPGRSNKRSHFVQWKWWWWSRPASS